MGLRHLTKIRDLLKKEKRAFSKTEIRDTLNFDYRTVLDVLAYLVEDGKVEEVLDNKGKLSKYIWK